VLGPDDAVAAKAFRNLQQVQLIQARELNAYDVLVNDVIVFTRETLPTSEAPATEPTASTDTDETEEVQS